MLYAVNAGTTSLAAEAGFNKDASSTTGYDARGSGAYSVADVLIADDIPRTGTGTFVFCPYAGSITCTVHVVVNAASLATEAGFNNECAGLVADASCTTGYNADSTPLAGTVCVFPTFSPRCVCPCEARRS